MEKLGLNEIRKRFLDFFESNDHFVRKSYSLIPEKDKSLLLINAGMAPLKPFFLGAEKPPKKRMTTCQKCIRTGDIDNVGHTARHATFFEMLGNFSFGDYFKVESISWGWEFVTKHLNIPVDKLWATIYQDDDEAFDIWKNKIGLPEERIVRLGKDDNFWEIGVGPCGPCSEIYFDRGEKYGCDNPDCKPGCDCDRYVEFWNHVFAQFNRDESGNYSPLPSPNIDTGMGLERMACIMQGVESIFEVDTIKYILDNVVKIANVKYESSNKPSDISVRIITDHIRSVTFLVSDGVLPSNEGRGYVLRRLLRRAARHGKLIGIKGSFLADLCDKVIDISKEAYPELEERKDYIKKIISVEEERFRETIDQGTNILNEFMEELEASQTTILSGEKAFKLYDTFGFPLELTQEILAEKNYTVDIEQFNSHMEQQKNMSRSARKSDTDAGWIEEKDFNLEKFGKTIFTGYDVLTDKGSIVAILKDNKEVTEALEGEKVKIILDKTPFYGESGGQSGDKGIIKGDAFEVNIFNCEKSKDIHIHEGVVKQGTVKLNTTITAEVDLITRNSTEKNHTATHLLHKALRLVVGQHVEQAGSMVSPTRLRFDFTHFESISKENLKQIETIVNTKINEFLTVETEETDIKTAVDKGATALFGEKYKDLVRVVSIGDFSMELCGGTHVKNAGQIGIFKILSENGVAAGVRRIEAITGAEVYQYINKMDDIIEKVNETLKSNTNTILTKLNSLSDECKAYKKDLEDIKKQMMNSSTDEIVKNAKEIQGVKLITQKFENADIKELRDLADEIKAKTKGVVIVFASLTSEKVTFMVSVSNDLLDKGIHAGNMIKQIAAAAGGGGGGKADMAQAGGKDPSKTDEAFFVAEKLLKSR